MTTDHGRAPNFKDHGTEEESARLWLVAAGGSIPRRGRVALDAPRALSDVTPTIQELAGLPRSSPRHIEALLP